MKAKKEINVSIGEQIKQARERALMTQEQLAENIEVSPQYISDLERGLVGISIVKLKCLCTTLSVTSDQILFPSQERNDVIALTERCSLLSPEHFRILTVIVNKYIEGIAVEKESRK